MSIIKRSIIILMALVTLAPVMLFLSGNGFILTSLKRTYLAGHITANINDHSVFATRVIATGEPALLESHPNYNQTPLRDEFIAELKADDTIAFLIIKDGQVISENYFKGYDNRSKTNSFSMAKTITTLLLGIAIDEGFVRDLDQPIIDFIPEFKQSSLGSQATIGQFSLMNSGYDWIEEYYSAFSPTVELYYGTDSKSFLFGGTFNQTPGEHWEYSSASTQIMALFLLRALQKPGAADTLSEYLSEKLWRPMQMNDDALWHLDGKGMELAYCCINTNARNFAKLGQLMLNGGQWNGKQLVSSEFIDAMIKPGSVPHYGLSTWLALDRQPSYYWFSGHLGQYIINVPAHNLTIVRLGERRNADLDFRTVTLPNYVEMALEVAGSN